MIHATTGIILKTVFEMTEAPSIKVTYYDSIYVKCTEKANLIETESRVVVARNWGKGSHDCNGSRASFRGDENVLNSAAGHIRLNRLKANE